MANKFTYYKNKVEAKLQFFMIALLRYSKNSTALSYQ